MSRLKMLSYLSAFALVLGAASCPGAPDTDGDGVPDIIDQCPAEPGPPENLGCPIVPPTAYNCDAPPATAGFVPLAHPVKDRYIVKLKDSGTALGVSSAAAIQVFATRFVGVQEVQTHLALRAFSAKIEAKSIKAILADPNVQYVEQEGTRSLVGVTWGLDRVDQRALPLDNTFDPGATGQGVHAYTNDTGVTPIQDLYGRVSPDCFSTIVFLGCEDGHGHGTHVSGTIAGTRWGVAKQAIIHSARFLDDKGSGSDTDAIRSLEWILQHNPGGRKVVNASWGGDPAPAIDEVVCKIIRAGGVFVAAAGNSELDSRTSTPARIKQVITVGASDRNDRQASFSNFGEGLDLYAPGVDIESDTPAGGSAVMSGTSMASPHAAGAAVLYLERHPTATPAQVEAGLVSIATPGKLSGLGAGSPNLLLYVREQ